MTTLEIIRRIAQVEFGDIVTFSELLGKKLRLYLSDRSFIDIYISQTIKNRFAFHWERQHLDGKIYRFDNFPDTKWKKVRSFPYHLHSGSQNRVIKANFSQAIIAGFRDFMCFAQRNIKSDNKKVT